EESGPVCPQEERDSITISCFTSRRASKSRPRRESTPGRKLSEAMSEIDTNFLANVTASGCFRLSRTDSLFEATWSNVAADMRPYTACGFRKTSNRVLLSILMHSAPSCVSKWVQKGPAA